MVSRLAEISSSIQNNRRERNTISSYLRSKARRFGARLNHDNNDQNFILTPTKKRQTEEENEQFFSLSSGPGGAVSPLPSSSPKSPSTADTAKSWEASLSMKGLDVDSSMAVLTRLKEAPGKGHGDKEVQLFSQEDEFLDVSCLNAALQRRLQRCVFQMYCATVQCTICLSNLSSHGEASKYVVKAKMGPDKCPRLTFCINMPNATRDEDEETGFDQDGMVLPLGEEAGQVSVACLPCGHKFCGTCMSSLITHKADTQHGGVGLAPLKMRIRCPLCRRKVKVTSVSYFTV